MPEHYRILSSISGLHPLKANRTTPQYHHQVVVTTKNLSRYVQVSIGGRTGLVWELLSLMTLLGMQLPIPSTLLSLSTCPPLYLSPHLSWSCFRPCHFQNLHHSLCSQAPCSPTHTSFLSSSFHLVFLSKQSFSSAKIYNPWAPPSPFPLSPHSVERHGLSSQ